MKKTPEELAAAKHRRDEAAANLACEGIFLTDDQKRMFEEFDALGLSEKERVARILASHIRPKVSADV